MKVAKQPLDRAQWQLELLERPRQLGEHRLHQVHVGFGVIGIAGLGRRGLERAAAQARTADMLVAEPIFRDSQQVPLDFEADHVAHALVGKPPQYFAQQLPRREVERHAAVEIFVAQHPADPGRPGQDAEGRWVGNDGEVGRAGHLGEPHPAAARERGEDAGIGGIERRGRDIDVVARGQRGDEGRHGDRLRPRRPMRVGPGEPHELQLFLLDPELDLLGLPPLIVGPKTVPFDEMFGLRRHRAPRNPDYPAIVGEAIGLEQMNCRPNCRARSP